MLELAFGWFGDGDSVMSDPRAAGARSLSTAQPRVLHALASLVPRRQTPAEGTRGGGMPVSAADNNFFCVGARGVCGVRACGRICLFVCAGRLPVCVTNSCVCVCACVPFVR
jgi:hypothetical protein